MKKHAFAQLSFHFKHITVNVFIHTEESLKLWAVIDSIKTNIEYLQYWILLCLTELVWSCVLPLHVASLHVCIQWWISSLMNTSRRPIKRLSASTERWTCSHTLTSSTPNPLIWQIHFPGRGRGVTLQSLTSTIQLPAQNRPFHMLEWGICCWGMGRI